MEAFSEAVAYVQHSPYRRVVYIPVAIIAIFAIGEIAVFVLSEVFVGTLHKDFIILLLLVIIFTLGSANGTKIAERRQKHQTQDAVSEDGCQASRQVRNFRDNASHDRGLRGVPQSGRACSSTARLPRLSTEAGSPMENIDEVPRTPPKVNFEQVYSDTKIIGEARREGFTLDSSNFQTVFAACARQYLFNAGADISIKLFKCMLEQRLICDPYWSSSVSRFFKSVSESLDEVCMQEVGVELIEAIRAHGLVPTQSVQNRIICAWRSKPPEHIVQLFMTLREEGVSLSPTVYRCLLAAFERSQPQLTLDIYDEMVNRGVKFDRAALNAALCACANLRMVKQAMELFEMVPLHGLVPNGKTYGSMIRVHTAVDMPREALNFFEMMRAANIEPNRYSFDDAIHCYVKLKSLSMAVALYQEMTRANMQPCEHTAPFLTAACLKQGWSKARIAGLRLGRGPQVFQAHRAGGAAAPEDAGASAPVVGEDADDECE
jgi:pentatricopeptide repeat protein